MGTSYVARTLAAVALAALTGAPAEAAGWRWFVDTDRAGTSEFNAYFGQAGAVHAQLRDDIQEQRLLTVALDLNQVFADASDLSAKHTARLLTRSLDLLHVAAAHAAGCSTFVSAADRQLAVAKASGMATIDIKRRHRPKR